MLKTLINIFICLFVDTVLNQYSEIVKKKLIKIESIL